MCDAVYIVLNSVERETPLQELNVCYVWLIWGRREGGGSSGSVNGEWEGCGFGSYVVDF